MEKAKRARQRKYHYIYKTTNLINGKFYIGMHSTDNLEDEYIGSGKRLWYSIRKHGKENHKKEILEFLPDRKSLSEREKQIVNEELLNNSLCMNLASGGGCGWDYVNKVGKNLYGTNGKNHIYLPKKPGEFKNILIKAGKWEKYKQTMSSSMKKYFSEHDHPWLNRKMTNEHRNKLKEIFNNIDHQKGEKNSNFGKRNVVVNKDGINKRILKDKLEEYLNTGWNKGFSKKNSP